ncbi:MAG: CPXCG motif-containing cysteine-rich protein [Pseudomonadales bacterium]
MEPLAEQIVSCPYCGEAIEVLIDHQDAGDQYIEDCQVCCRPIVFNVAVDSMGNLSVTVHDENEPY